MFSMEDIKRMAGEHVTLMDAVRVNQSILNERQPQIDLLVETLAGPLLRDQFTGKVTGERGDGISHKIDVLTTNFDEMRKVEAQVNRIESKVDELEHRTNGGGGVSISLGSKFAIGIISALISGFFLVLAAAVSGAMS